MSARGITIIGASAGSGKTYRLTQEVTTAIDPKGPSPVPLEGLFAVTYTKKAHAELTARIRQSLVGVNAFTEAMRLPMAYIGTVHAACLRLLRELALDAGLSPSVDVIAEDQGILLRQALESAMPDSERDRLDALAARFRLHWNASARRFDWLSPVSDIMELARGNRIAPTALEAMGRRSADGILRLLPASLSLENGSLLNGELAVELANAGAALAATREKDQTNATEAARHLIEDSRKRHADDELDWYEWAKLATITTGKQSAAAVEKLRAAASRYEVHPQFHHELRLLIEAIFDAARIGLSAYQDWKRDRRVVDYVDMLDGALDLVMHPRARPELSERLRLVVVDEFQDTSPIQLALFVELHKIAKRSVWVGDRKQCIFEYAGADPQLMDAVTAWVTRSGGEHDALTSNYRSRPALVHACNELFARALERHQFAPHEVVVKPVRKDLPALDSLPPFGLWCLESKKVADDAEAVAEGVRRMLASPAETPVVDRMTQEARAVRPGDIAILVATNAEAANIAVALHARGLRAAIARDGLLKTPEGVLVDAALRWLVDDNDSLAAATIDALTGCLEGNETADAWLGARIRGEAIDESTWRAPLGEVRSQLSLLSPSEALDEAARALDLVILCARWPEPAQRVANIDALRALAAVYEERCGQDREAATVAGLVRYFEQMSAESLVREEMLAPDNQHVPADDGAVIVATYHKAKGLEWPVVVMASLDRGERRDAFEVSPESEEGMGFNPEAPLSGRWIRYWPWPLGTLKKLPLADRAATSAEGQRVAAREERERARLLYVGFTRARDHLVLAVRTTGDKAKATWLEALRTSKDEPAIGLCLSAQDGSTANIMIGGDAGHAVSARVWRLPPTRGEAGEQTETPSPRWFARGDRVIHRAGYRIRPSNAAEDWPEVLKPAIRGCVTVDGALPMHGDVRAYNVLGDAVHGFFAADLDRLPKEQRLLRAERLIASAELEGVLRPADLLDASDRFQAFAHSRWPGAIWHREVPVDVCVETASGTRRVIGAIDLLLETKTGYVVIDHKTFPGSTEIAWRAKAKEFLGQMGAYCEALKRVPNKQIEGCWLHFPVGGGLVELTVR